MNIKTKRYLVTNGILLIIVFVLSSLPLRASTTEEQRMLAGYTSVVKSVDCYLRGVYNYQGLYGENTEVNGDLTMCNNVIIAQYPARIEGYLRFYEKTGSVEYQKLAEQLIDKLFKIYSLTKDKNGDSWLPIQDVVTRSGQLYGYSKGESFIRLFGEQQHPVSYDQSNGIYLVSGGGFPDAFGFGSLEIAKLFSRKDKGILKDEYRDKYIKILECLMDFYHRDYMLYKRGDVFYYRTDDVTPKEPKMPIPKPKWSELGADVVYVALALQESGVNTDKWDFPLSMFLKYYLSERRDHNGESRINFLDNRMLDLCEYFKKKNKEEGTIKEIYGMLRYIYEKNGTINALFMLNGATKTSSSLPNLEIYRKLGLKGKYKELYDDIWEKSFDADRGILVDGRPASINGSGYHAILSYSYSGWKAGMISNEEFLKAYNKYYKFKGNPVAFRDLDDWVIESSEIDRLRPGWTATPTDYYQEGIESEGYYGGEAQGYSLNRVRLGEDKNTIEIQRKAGALKTDEDKMKLSNKINEYLAINRVRKGEYRQFVSVFAVHGEAIRYGEALTFNLIDTKDKFEYDREGDKIKIKLDFSGIPKGLTCFGVADISSICTGNNLDYDISKVICNNKEVPFTVSRLEGYPEIFKNTKNTKILFQIDYNEENKDTLEVFLGKKEYKTQINHKALDKSKTAFIETEAEDKEIVQLADKLRKTQSRVFPFPSYAPGQQKTVNQEYKKSEKIVEELETKKMIIPDEELVFSNWKDYKRAVALKCESKIFSTWLKALLQYLEPSAAQIRKVGLAEKIEQLTEINENMRTVEYYSKEMQVQVLKGLSQNVESLLQVLPKGNNAGKLKKITSVLKFMIIYPELNISAKNIDFVWNNLNIYLLESINEDGLVKDGSNYEMLRELTELLRLCRQNKVSFPKEILEITAKLAENLMYMMDGEGCLSQTGSDGERINLRQQYYWLGKILNRLDFRYISFGGMEMIDSIPPKENTRNFPKSGYVIMRNSWDMVENIEFDNFRKEIQAKNSAGEGFYSNSRMKMLTYNANTGKFEIYSNGEIQFKYLGNEELKSGKIAKFESNEECDFLRVEKDGDSSIYQRIWFFKKYGVWFIDTTLTNDKKPLEAVFEFSNSEINQEKKEERQLQYTMHNFNPFKRIPQNMFRARNQGEVVFEITGSGMTRLEKETEEKNGLKYGRLKYLQQSSGLINWQMIVTAFEGGRGQIGEISGRINEGGRIAVNNISREFVEKGLPNVNSRLYNDKVELLLGNEKTITINLVNEGIEIK